MTRKTKIISSFLLSGVCITSGYAAQSSPHDFTIGLLTNYYLYKETRSEDNSFFMQYKGYMIGAVAAYAYTNQSGFRLGVEADFSAGRAHYKGGLIDTNKPYERNGIKQSKYEGRFLVGKNFYLDNNFTLTPYTGFGIRVKSDHSGPDYKRKVHGHKRRSTYFYIPIGLKLKRQICSDWAIETFGEFNYLVIGKMRSEYVAPVPTGGALTNTQKNGYGLRGGLDIIKNISEKHAVSFGPFVNFWHIKDSNSVRDKDGYPWIEPNNKTLEAGITLKYRF